MLPRSSPSTAGRMSPETPTTAGAEPWEQDLAPGPPGNVEHGDSSSSGCRALPFHPCRSMGCERTAGDVHGASAPPAHPRGLLLALSRDHSIVLRARGDLEGEVAPADPSAWEGDAAAPGHPGTRAAVTRLGISPRERIWAVWSSGGS